MTKYKLCLHIIIVCNIHPRISSYYDHLPRVFLVNHPSLEIINTFSQLKFLCSFKNDTPLNEYSANIENIFEIIAFNINSNHLFTLQLKEISSI